MFLQTGRLILRKFEESDFPDFCAYAMDPERCRMMATDELPDIPAARASFDWLRTNQLRWYAIVYKETGHVIGHLTVYDSTGLEDRPEFAGKAGRALSFCIAQDYRRRGLMTEALRAVIDRLFHTEGADYIASGYFGFNIPSRELHKKLGFVPLATAFIDLNGETVESVDTVLWKN